MYDSTKICQDTQFQDSASRGACVALTSEVYAVVMLALLTIRNSKLRRWNNHEWHNVNTLFS
jgi:hypothetical protein